MHQEQQPRKKPKPLPRHLQKTAINERNKGFAVLGSVRYADLVAPFGPHLRAAMQREDCDALTAAIHLGKSLCDLMRDPAARRLVVYAAVDIQFGPLETSAA